MRHFFVVIVLTGAITLSLELLASRIMTPYFGVSLFIWSGILSITLIALALGYWWGGRLCRAAAKSQRDKLFFYFGLMPAVSCNSLVVSCLLYPKVFVHIAKIHLVFGSFLACIILLLVPLICLSAMNPILVALRRLHERKEPDGDAGAGWVFFISTIGSVAGVLVTAFILIPTMTNFRSVLLLSFLLSMLAILCTASPPQPALRQRRIILRLALLGATLSLLLLSFSDWYLKKNREIVFGDRSWKLLDEIPTFFGNVKVVEMSIGFDNRSNESESESDAKKIRLYFTDGSIQSTVGDDGNSQSLYIYAFESLGRGACPRPNRILVLGFAAGCLPMRFIDDRTDIDAVEINPVAQKLAEQYFHFNPSAANVINGDARVYVGNSDEEYDLIFVDLFQNDSSVPEYLLAREFMQDLGRRLSSEGAILFNVASRPHSKSHYSILKTIGTEFAELRMFHLDTDDVTNIMVVASHRRFANLRPAALPNVPGHLFAGLTQMLTSNRPIEPFKLATAEIMTDDSNSYSFMNGYEMLQNRRLIIERFPAELLVN